MFSGFDGFRQGLHWQQSRRRDQEVSFAMYKRAYRILAEQGEDGASETTEFADIIEKIRNKKGAGAGGEFAGIFNFQHYAWLQKP